MIARFAALGWINNDGPHEAALNMEQDWISQTYESLAEPDLAWTHIDAAGHFHGYDDEGKLPTLNATQREMPCDGGCSLGPDCEGYSVTVRHCHICREEIEPAQIVKYNVTKRYPGMRHWSAELTMDRLPDGVLGETVSVRISSGGHEWFGTAGVTSFEAVSWGQSKLHLIGVGALGRRKVPTSA